jgi:hypothetical protein
MSATLTSHLTALPHCVYNIVDKCTVNVLFYAEDTERKGEAMRKRLQPGGERRGWHCEDEHGEAEEHAYGAMRRERRPPRSRCAGSPEEEAEKEEYADALLHEAYASTPRSACGTRAYTERQMVRKVAGRVTTRLDVTGGESIADWRPSDTTLNTIQFLLSVSQLSRREKYFVRGWMLGWTQQECADRWKASYGTEGGSVISGVLKRALSACCDTAPVSFSAFSRHAIYRKPRPVADRLARCIHCQEPYPYGTGSGAYCSISCRFAALHR